MLVVVLVLENPDRFAIRLKEQISSIGLFAVTESQCTEDEDDSKFRNLGLAVTPGQFIAMLCICWDLSPNLAPFCCAEAAAGPRLYPEPSEHHPNVVWHSNESELSH